MNSGRSQSFQSSEPSPAKRKVTTPTKDKPVKRQKSESNQSATKGQQSLKGFFQVQNKGTNTTANATGSVAEDDDLDVKGLTANAYGVHDEPVVVQSLLDNPDNDNYENSGSPVAPADPASLLSGEASPTETASPSPSDFFAQLAAVEQNQRSWNALFSKPAAPLCEGHTEPCKTMQTKKKGSNQGRSFWMCARPLGPSGNKERGTQWRCPTFIWCSDWVGKKDGAKDGG